MASQNEQDNVRRMIASHEALNQRICDQDKKIIEQDKAIYALNERIIQLVQQMQQTMLIGRGSGPTA